MAAPRGNSMAQGAILFADIAGSTQLYTQLGNARAQDLVGRSLTAMSEVVAQHHGVVVKTIGDEVMCRFEKPDDAFDAAIAIQRRMRANPTDAPVAVAVRIGMHFGDLLHMAGDVYGDAVNVASRVASMAKRDQILTTEATVNALDRHRKAMSNPFDRVALKGRTGEIGLWMIAWDEAGDATQLRSTASHPAVSLRQLKVTYEGATAMLIAEGAALTLGRANECNVVVRSNYASRLHARVIVRRGKFVLVDESTNGTYVGIGAPGSGMPEMFIKREELPLAEQGTISLGQSTMAPDAHLVRFETTPG